MEQIKTFTEFLNEGKLSKQEKLDLVKQETAKYIADNNVDTSMYPNQELNLINISPLAKSRSKLYYLDAYNSKPGDIKQPIDKVIGIIETGRMLCNSNGTAVIIILNNRITSCCVRDIIK